MSNLRDEWKRLREIREAEREEAEHVKMPPVRYREFDVDESMDTAADEMIRLLNEKGSDG